MYTLYCHINTINHKRYVGITKRKPEYRWNNGEGYVGCTAFYRAIKKYGWHNFEHRILYTHLTKQVAEKLEKLLIKEWKTTDKQFGYNIESGGNLGKEVSEETKKKISRSLKGRKVHHSKQTREKISKALKGRPLSEETKRKMSLFQKGRHKTQEQINMLIKNSPNKIAVIQYDLLGNIINKFASMRDASRFTGINNKRISACCCGRSKTAGGYVWKKEIK